MQPNYAKVTSAADDDLDHLARAYGSLAAEIDPEDRLKLLSARGSRRGSRSSKDSEATLRKAARSLETESGQAPSRSQNVEVDPASLRDGKAKDPTANRTTHDVPPQILGRQVPTTGAEAPRERETRPRAQRETTSDALMKHIELPPPASAAPAAAVVPDDVSQDTETESETDASDTPREKDAKEERTCGRDAKFDALDAELAEHLEQDQQLDPSSLKRTLHASVKGLPKSKTKSSGKDRKKLHSAKPSNSATVVSRV